MNIKSITKFLVDHAPAIFTGLAIVGTVETTVLAVKGTPKAIDKMEKAYLDKGESLTKTEIVKATYKCYIPAAASGAMTIAFIILANRAHIKKETALAATMSFFENRYESYRRNTINECGEEADEKIQEAIAKEQMENNPPPSYLKRYAEEDGEFLCYEPITDQYFVATKNQILWAELTANKMMQIQDHVTLNMVLKLFPGCITDKPIGDKRGWYLDDSYFEYLGYNWGFYGHPWMDIKSKPEMINGQEVMVIDFTIKPTKENMWVPEEVEDSQK